jgi:beta-lactamase regulating signal transducer with metallopeptidase domain
MLATSLQQMAVGILASVASAAVRSLALAGVAGALLVLFRVKNVSLRLAIWKVVLWSALAMPLLAWLSPPMPLALPGAVISKLARFIPTGETLAQAASPDGSSDAVATRVRQKQWSAHTASADAQAARRGVASPSETRIALSGASSPRVNAAAVPASGGAAKNRNVSVARLFIALYFAIAILLLSRLFVGWMLGRRLIRSSHPIRDPRASLSLSLRAFPGHFNEAPLLAESESVAVPVTLGVVRPVILLPVDWREWESDKLNAILAHELSHIGRNDALTQRLSKLHRAIYWFSPLAWWLDRELARLAEEASDEAALASGADRERYAEMLLRFFEAIRAASGRVWWQGVSMAAGGDAAKRVDRILSWKGAVTMRLRKTFVAALAAIALPLLLAVASIQFTAHAQQTAPPARVAPAPAAAPQAPTPTATPYPRPQTAPYATPDSPDTLPSLPGTPDLPAPPQRSVAAAPPAPPVAGATPPSQLAPLAPIAPVAPIYAQVQSGDSNVWVMDDEHVRDPYVIAVGGSYIGVFNHSVTIDDSGESKELAHVKELHGKIDGDFIWFEHEGKGYVIRDRATIDRAMELYKPIQELGAEQDELGKKQDELGKQQDELGDQMEEVKVKIPDMTEDIEHIKERVRELSAKGGTQSEIGDLQSELGELQSRIGEIQSRAGREQSKIGRQQGELGRKQGELGRQQGALGRKQGELSKKVLQQMESILDEAREKGLTQPE